MNPATKRDLEILRITRTNISNLIQDLSYEQMIKIPNGFSNSILWNLGHLAVTQQILCIGLAGGDTTLPTTWMEKFRKGSNGSNNISEEEYDELKKDFVSLVDVIENNYEDLQKNPFKTYTTSYNITLNSLDETIQFVNTHEGLHFGVMMALRKFA